jgi:hypothetical protein
MGSTPGSARSVIAGLLAIMLAAAVTQGTAHAQSAPPPFGGQFAIVPAVDINLLPDMLSARPKLAQLVRF